MRPTFTLTDAGRALFAAFLIGCSRTPDASSAQTQQQPPRAPVSESRRTAITTAVASVTPSVVTVQTTQIVQVNPDVMSQFFGARPGTRATPGLGTGFIVRADGVIVTNAHVVAGADTISVMLRDGTVYPATRLGADEANDIAVLKINAKNLPVAKLGNSTDLLVGEWSIAIGNPYGFVLGNSEPTVTAGVISGVGRNLLDHGEGVAQYYDMIQTDASINPGNSGGPLVNADGEVIGVNSSIYSNSGGSVGIGFAIPINRVTRVVEDLLDHGQVRHPWIGIQLQQVNTRNPRDLINQATIVYSIVPESPAAAAGLRTGDVLKKVGTHLIRNSFDLDAALLDLRVGEVAPIEIVRDGRPQTFKATIKDLPDVAATKVKAASDFDLVTVTPAIQGQRRLAVSEGALVFNISRASSDATGIQPGDVIVQINQWPVKTADEAKKALDYFASGSIRALVVRGNTKGWSLEFRIK